MRHSAATAERETPTVRARHDQKERDTKAFKRQLLSFERTIMNRISKTLLVLSLSTATSAALAVDSAFPSSADDQIPLSAEFPNMRTYVDVHRNDAMARSSTREEPSIAEEGRVRGVAGLDQNGSGRGATR
jgi:hypothetical protein